MINTTIVTTTSTFPVPPSYLLSPCPAASTSASRVHSAAHLQYALRPRERPEKKVEATSWVRRGGSQFPHSARGGKFGETSPSDILNSHCSAAESCITTTYNGVGRPQSSTGLRQLRHFVRWRNSSDSSKVPVFRQNKSAHKKFHQIKTRDKGDTVYTANEHPAPGVHTAQKRKHSAEYIGDHLPHAMLERPPPASPGLRLIN
ncbi:hypothetical protein C8J57DRAFT_1236556 [Mycena rebaudengoi]|nr:hypothetical protein C8J57DRAFT_1236556 [Mycena rebaudengoi]